MDSADDLLIGEVDGELESVMQQVDRRAMGAIDPNAADAAAGPLTADVAQVCPARLRSFLSCGACRAATKGYGLTEKRHRLSGAAPITQTDQRRRWRSTTPKTRRELDKRFVNNAQARRASRCASSLWSGGTSCLSLDSGKVRTCFSNG